MIKKKSDINEGDLCLIPLIDGTSVLSLIVRIDRKYGFVLLYVFDLRHNQLIQEYNVSLLKAKTQRIFRTGDNALLDGRWPIIGKLESWIRAEWPMPVFVLHLEITDEWVARTYSEEALMHMLSSRKATPEEIRSCPEDRIYGCLSVEKHLNQAFGLLPIPPKKELKPPPPGSMGDRFYQALQKKKKKKKNSKKADS